MLENNFVRSCAPQKPETTEDSRLSGAREESISTVSDGLVKV